MPVTICTDASRLHASPDINTQFKLYETQLEDLSDEVMLLNQRMEGYLSDITTRAEYYRTCQS